MISSDQLYNRLRYGNTISPAKFGGILVITSILITLGYLYYTGLWDALLKKIVDLSQKYGSVTIDTLHSCYTDSFNAIKAVFEQYHGRPVKSFSPVKSTLFSAVVYGIPVGMYANSIYTKNNQLQRFLEGNTLATTTSIPAGASVTKIMFLDSTLNANF